MSNVPLNNSCKVDLIALEKMEEDGNGKAREDVHHKHLQPL